MSMDESTAAQCGCGPDEYCFDCATDEELAAAFSAWSFSAWSSMRNDRD